THGPGSEGLPPVLVDDRGVLEIKPGSVGSFGGEPDLDLGDLVPVLPSDLEQVRGLALENLAAGVALELEAATLAQLARDWHEPPPDALRVREGVPHVRDGRVVRALERDRTGLARRDPSSPDRAVYGFQLAADLLHLRSSRFLLGALVVASLVALCSIACR